MRALLLDFPHDPRLRKVDTEFLFGDNLLVAPFLSAEAERSVYLPAGCAWHDFRSGEKHAGGQEIVCTGIPGDVPLFVKDNTLLPLAEPVEHIDPDTVFRITVRVYGRSPETFSLFEDDGETYDYAKGEYNTVTLHWDGQGTVTRTGDYDGERYRIAGWESGGAGVS